MATPRTVPGLPGMSCFWLHFKRQLVASSAYVDVGDVKYSVPPISTRLLSNVEFSGSAYEQTCFRPVTFLGVISVSGE